MISLFQPSLQGACQSAIDLLGELEVYLHVVRRELATVSLADQEEQEVEKIPSIEEALDAMESELVDTSINPRRPS